MGMKTVYVAHPIDQRDPHAGPSELILAVNDELGRMGYSSYWPRAPWHFEGGVDTRVVGRVNQAVQGICDGTVAILPGGMVTWGVPAEIERCVHDGLPVAVISDRSQLEMVQLRLWAEQGVIVDHNPRNALLALEDAIEAKRGQQEAKEALRVQLANDRAAGCVPTRAYEGDAGFDLYCCEDTVVKAGQWMDVPMGIAVELPAGVWAMIVGRSSSWRRKHIDVKPSIIDQGYRGPIFVACQNIGDLALTVKEGERVAQLIPIALKAQELAVQVVDRLNSSDRGEAGFGSSGV